MYYYKSIRLDYILIYSAGCVWDGGIPTHTHTQSHNIMAYTKHILFYRSTKDKLNKEVIRELHVVLL